MIIDTHTHFYDPSRPQGVPWLTPDNPLLYRTVLPAHGKAVALPAGVTGTVVVEASNWLEDNQWILDLAAQDGFLVGLVGHIEPNRPAFAAELERFAANPLFRGIRCGGRYLAAITQGSFLADMALLAAKSLSLDVLLTHEQFDARYQRLAAQPNISMKVSALMEQSVSQPAPTDLAYYRPTLDVLWQTFGEDRLIYGSNWPVCERAGDFYGEGINIVSQYFQEKGEAACQKLAEALLMMLDKRRELLVMTTFMHPAESLFGGNLLELRGVIAELIVQQSAIHAVGSKPSGPLLRKCALVVVDSGGQNRQCGRPPVRVP